MNQVVFFFHLNYEVFNYNIDVVVAFFTQNHKLKDKPEHKRGYLKDIFPSAKPTRGIFSKVGAN
jgi:hypothetical protein